MVDLQNIKPTLSNVQYELLKVFSMGLPEKELKELQKLLYQFLKTRIENLEIVPFEDTRYSAIAKEWQEKDPRKAKELMQKARAAADKAFIERGYNEETIEQWLNED